jgi:hypothetical protein
MPPDATPFEASSLPRWTFGSTSSALPGTAGALAVFVPLAAYRAAVLGRLECAVCRTSRRCVQYSRTGATICSAPSTVPACGDFTAPRFWMAGAEHIGYLSFFKELI